MGKPNLPTTEIREVPFTAIESRADGDGLTLEGYAAVFNSPTTIDSWEGQFQESIAPGAFKRSISHKTPVLQFDHGHHPLIGGLPIGTIRSLKEDTHGLRVSARLSDNWLIHPVRDAIRDKAVTGMSFRFTVHEDEWSDDFSERIIKVAEVHELGPVVFPAYQTTTVGVRSAGGPVDKLIDLIRSDEGLREMFAAALFLGTSEDRANDEEADDDSESGTSEDRAETDTKDPDAKGRRERMKKRADVALRRIHYLTRS